MHNFKDGCIGVLIATVAFGLGVHNPDVVNVIHYGASKNILTFWQEVGRCGRDGRQEKATLYLPPPQAYTLMVYLRI